MGGWYQGCEKMSGSADRRKDSLIRLPEVRRRSGLSTATIYRKMSVGQFPRSIRLSVNIVAWYKSDVDRWVANPMGWIEEATNPLGNSR